MRLGFAAMLRVRVSALGKVIVYYNCVRNKIFTSFFESHRNSIDDQRKISSHLYNYGANKLDC